MEFLLLGPVEAREDGRSLQLGGPRQRALLAMLLLNANRVLTVDRLIDGLWEDAPPASARQSIHFLVHRLRKALGDAHELLVTRGAGYVAQVSVDQVDVLRFEALVASGRAARAAGDLGTAAQRLDQAHGLWRGRPLADLGAAAFAGAAVARLEELYAAALEDRFDIAVALGGHVEAVAELERLVWEFPLRERLRGLLMVALYRSGRQAEALQAYQAARDVLVEELGIEPGPELQRLERAVLTGDGSLDLPAASVPEPPAVRDPGAPPSAGVGDERRTVTVLVAGPAEGAAVPRDPEDHVVWLAAETARFRGTVQRYGGELVDVPGGVLVGIFGATVVREDDPERAVRAALELRDADGTDGALRMGIESGMALVTHAGGPSPTGEVLSRAASLHASAGAGEILVGMPTVLASARAIDYGDAPDGLRPGMAARVARQPRSRVAGRAEPDVRAPLIERGQELTLLVSLFERVLHSREPHLVTIVGVPGIGKSRLVRELGRVVEDAPDLVTWRQGRSLPYGEGVSLWALGEIVKVQAGILDDDGIEAAEGKLAKAVEDALTAEGEEPVRADLAWVTASLRPLVAGRTEALAGRDRLGETLAACQRFVEGMAERRPLVLIFEDIQWADEGLVDFVEGLTREVGQVPLLAICVARPELLDRRPRWGGGHRDATIISLGPMSGAGTEELLAALVEGAKLPAVTVAALRAGAGGNPLFVEEYVGMLRDRGTLSGATSTAEALLGEPTLAMPDSVGRVIAARLDLLEADDKALLRDAAVLGEVGWVGALAAVSGRSTAEVAAWLRRVERRELVRPVMRASVRGETEFTFRHVLIRDVAYGQLPRALRAERHRRAAAWIESLSPDRGADQAELLAHHYQLALELARATGEATGELVERARAAFRAAGERARGLGVYPTAARFYGAALELWPADDLERPELLLHHGEALVQGQTEGVEVLTEASAGLLAAGNPDLAAEAESMLGLLKVDLGQGRAAAGHFLTARRLAEQASPSRSTIVTLDRCANSHITGGDYAEAARLSARAHELATQLGLAELEASTLSTLGEARFYAGDADGLADVERAVESLKAMASPRLVRSLWNLATAYCVYGDVARGDRLDQEIGYWARRFGAGRQADGLATLTTFDDYWAGRWDGLLQMIERLVTYPDGSPRPVGHTDAHLVRGRLRLARGELDLALEEARTCLRLARDTAEGQNGEDPERWHSARSLAARALLAAGQEREAAEHLDALLGSVGGYYLNSAVGIDLGVVMVALGRPASELADQHPNPSRWLEANLAFAGGDPGRAAEVLALIGSKPDEADAHLAAAQALHAAGRGDEAASHLAQATAFYERVGATGYLAEASNLRKRLDRG